MPAKPTRKNIKILIYYKRDPEHEPRAGMGPRKFRSVRLPEHDAGEHRGLPQGLHARESPTRRPGSEVNQLRSISVLGIIIAAFVFGSFATAAVPAEPELGAGEEKILGTIGGTVFLDADANGVQDTAERGMSGVSVHLLDAAGERIATAETYSHACEGLYIFSGILPGNYTIEIALPDGYAFTAPGRGAPGETASTVDPANGTTTAINLTGEAIRETDLVVRDAGLVPAGS